MFPACKKEAVDALPKATQSGANTAGCLVNGNAFVAQKLGSGPGSVEAISGGFSYDSLYYIRFAGKHGSQEATIRLFLRSVR
ncbi:hypothetical protein [Hymenobacter sediminicola]|uniref:Uncharacterized protein n=1 Tax=Hymenobacter sediminicola TaxID=2761579 RepID=A0A7G7W5F2_9BACT|nr:hypothetical protein [Hymenobacter sediminicola]QNH61595.1 hypothetical protein H4317_15740 [Hymenobacter sediminicola]